MRILLTGISGFVGAAVAKRLYQTDHDLVALVRDKRDLPLEILERFDVIQGDMTKDLPEISCELIIHCAALTSDKVMSTLLNKTNVDGTKKLLENLSGVKRMLHVSSASVYNLSSEHHREDETINPVLLTSYGKSKFMTEEMLRTNFSNSLDITVLRPRGIYGKGDRVLLPRIMKLYKKGKIVTPGDLQVHASMTLVDRFVDVVMEFIKHQDPGFHIYNVADKDPYLLADTIGGLFNSIFKKEIPIDSRSENLVRIIAGFTTIIRPGSNLTQTAIDYLTRDHILSTKKLEKKLPHLDNQSFYQYLPEYTRWINDIGLSNIIGDNVRLPWM